MLAWELSTLAQQPYQDLAPSLLSNYLRDGYRLAQPATCPDVLYQLMAFCWAINAQHRPRAALLVDYLAGLDQGVTNCPPTSSDADDQNVSILDASLQESSSDGSTSGSDCPRRSKATLVNSLQNISSYLPSESVNTKSNLTTRPSSHFNSPISNTPGLPTVEEYTGIDQASLYSTPINATDDDTTSSSTSQFSSAVYSTPTCVVGTVPWKLPTQKNVVEKTVPPPLPPANAPSAAGLKPQRPQHPLPPQAIIL